jgi:hypothetical protein
MKKRPAPVTLWTIIESLQRRLERQGCSRETIDLAVVSAIARAVA